MEGLEFRKAVSAKVETKLKVATNLMARTGLAEKPGPHAAYTGLKHRAGRPTVRWAARNKQSLSARKKGGGRTEV
jgi:hypothetical protein